MDEARTTKPGQLNVRLTSSCHLSGKAATLSREVSRSSLASSTMSLPRNFRWVVLSCWRACAVNGCGVHSLLCSQGTAGLRALGGHKTIAAVVRPVPCVPAGTWSTSWWQHSSSSCASCGVCSR
jgi:hypothetical protein